MTFEVRHSLNNRRWTTVTLDTWWEYDAFAAQAEARGYYLRRVA